MLIISAKKAKEMASKSEERKRYEEELRKEVERIDSAIRGAADKGLLELNIAVNSNYNIDLQRLLRAEDYATSTAIGENGSVMIHISFAHIKPVRRE